MARLSSAWFAFSLLCFILLPTQLSSAISDGDDKDTELQEAEEFLLVYEPSKEKSNGKHIVLISGDEEYRSEEVVPMLGQILSQHHGFRCTVLFAINPETKEIDPDNQKNIPGISKIENADLIIMSLRFRNLPDADMEFFDNYLKSGRPIIGLRTSTHAFRMSKESKFNNYSFNSKEWKGGFGQQILGDTWINHHGAHKKESTRGVVEQANAGHIVMKGVKDVWGDTDVYGIRNLSDDAKILLYGEVLKGMKPTDEPVDGKKNDPMMPVAWLKPYEVQGGQSGMAFCTTMGSSTDFANEGLRRLIVNAAFHLTSQDDQIDGKAKVDFVTKFEPSMYGFKGYRKGMKPADFLLPKKQ